MKMNSAHFDKLASLIATVDTAEAREAYRNGQFPRSDRVNNLDMRYRWDMFWACGPHDYMLDGDYKDSHIDTALRKLVQPLDGPTYMD